MFLSDFFIFETNNEPNEAVRQPELKDQWPEIPEVPGCFWAEQKLPRKLTGASNM